MYFDVHNTFYESEYLHCVLLHNLLEVAALIASTCYSEIVHFCIHIQGILLIEMEVATPAESADGLCTESEAAGARTEDPRADLWNKD